MSMTATANGQMSGKSDGSSALSWNHRALRLPVAVSLALHASVFAGALFWWQANGTPAPKGLPEGMSVTFVRLSEPAPAAPLSAPAATAKPVTAPQPEISPAPEPVVEHVPAPMPAPVAALPAPEPEPQPVEAQPKPAAPAASAFQTASLAPPDARDGRGEGASRGFEETEGAESDEVLIVNPRFRTPPRPPAYPKRARELDQQGVTMLRIKLDQRGDPLDVHVLDSSGYALLDHAAVRAVRKWQFQPAIHNGRPVVAFVELPIEFVLTEAR